MDTYINDIIFVFYNSKIAEKLSDSKSGLYHAERIENAIQDIEEKCTCHL